MSSLSIKTKAIVEGVSILCFYLLVAASSITNLGIVGALAFFFLLLLCSKIAPRTGAIVLLAMFYLPVAGLNIPNVFIISTVIVAIANFSYVKKNLGNPVTAWILRLYSLFFVFRLMSFVSATNTIYFWSYIFISFSVLVHIVVFSCLINEKNDIVVILKWWGIIGAMSAVLGYIHFIYSGSVYLRQVIKIDAIYDKATIEGTFDLVRWIWAGAEPNFTGLQLLIPLTINLGFLFRKFSIFGLILSVTTFLGVLGTYSRTSFLIAVLIVVLFILLSKSRYKYLPIALIPIAAFVVVIYFPEFVDRIDTIQAAATKGQGSGRFPLYIESINNFFSNPVIGIGAGQTPIISKYKLEGHNLFLQTLGENGIFGFLCLILLFIRSFKQTYTLRKREPIYIIALLAIVLNCNTVSAFDMRTILSFVVIISFSYYYASQLSYLKGFKQ